MGRFIALCFFKQKTAYEMLRSLVGSEMCIRDRVEESFTGHALVKVFGRQAEAEEKFNEVNEELYEACLLYTSDAADDLLCVDLGGRRIIKKKNKLQPQMDVRTKHVDYTYQQLAAVTPTSISLYDLP